MTIVEKAAYLKGLTEGLGLDAESKDGKLWSALNELLSDMAHEIEDLQANGMDFAEALDDISQDLSYLEELTCDLDVPEDMMDDSCSGSCCPSCQFPCSEDRDEDDEELTYDGVLYDVTCPSCGDEITFDEDTLKEGFIACPNCGETLEFDLDEDGED